MSLYDSVVVLFMRIIFGYCYVLRLFSEMMSGYLYYNRLNNNNSDF